MVVSTVRGMPNTPDQAPLPPGVRQRFSDPAVEPVYAAIKSLDGASQHQMLRALHVKLHAEDVAAEGSQPTWVAQALTALNHAARELGHPPSVEEYRRLYREGMRESGWPDDRCIRRWLGSACSGWRGLCPAAIPRTAPGAGQRLPHR